MISTLSNCIRSDIFSTEGRYLKGLEIRAEGSKSNAMTGWRYKTSKGSVHLHMSTDTHKAEVL